MSISSPVIKKIKKADIYFGFIKKMLIFLTFVLWFSTGDQETFRSIICTYIAFSTYFLIKKVLNFKQEILNQVNIRKIKIAYVEKMISMFFYSIWMWVIPAVVFTCLYQNEFWLTSNILLIQFGASWVLLLLIFFIVWAMYQVKHLIQISLKALLKIVSMKFFLMMGLIIKNKELLLNFLDWLVKKIEIETEVLFLFEHSKKIRIHKKSIEVIGY